jgi:hypothetical protein
MQRINMIANDEQFLDETLELAGFNPEIDDFEFLKENLRPLLDERINLKLLQRMSEKNRNMFMGRLANDDSVTSEEIDEFLRYAIPDLDDFMADIYIEFQNEYLQNFKS